jgi:hypothetical protein
MRLSKPVIGELADMRSARNGDYRILVRFDDAEHEVWSSASITGCTSAVDGDAHADATV